MQQSRRRFTLALAATACGSALPKGAHAAEVTSTLRAIRFASVGGTTDAPLFIAQELGFFHQVGMTLRIQRMSTAPALTAAIATDQLDVAGISLTPGLYASVAQHMNLRLVGDKQSLRPGFSATRMIIRPALAGDDEAGSMRALKGRKIAVSSKAASTFYLLVQLLAKHGLRLHDVQVVELSFPNMLPALTSGAIDGAVSLEPFLSQAVEAKAASVVSDLTEFVPPGGSIVPLVYSEKFASDTAAAHDFMKAYVQGVRAYNDAFVKGAKREEVIGIIAKYASVDREMIKRSFLAGLDPNQHLSLDFFRTVQEFFLSQNMLRMRADLTRLVDTSFADAAVAHLGAYDESR